MPDTHSRSRIESLIQRARIYRKVNGMLCMDLAAQLIEAGCLVADLEKQWDEQEEPSYA